MSEYQYYEFRAVERALTEQDQDELGQISSRAEITASSFVNVYNYGDFGGRPRELMERYFDAFLYLANRGTRKLMLRVPGRLLALATAAEYEAGEALSCRRHGDDVILSLSSDDERDHGWVEGEGWLASILPIRAALMEATVVPSFSAGWWPCGQGLTLAADDRLCRRTCAKVGALP